MGIVIHSIQLSENVEKGAKGGPQWNTDIVPLDNGRENANQRWTYPRHMFNIGYGSNNSLERTDWMGVKSFHFVRRGRLFGFHFKDWADYAATATAFGTGDGVLTAFQLYKTYTDGTYSYTRKITRPRYAVGAGTTIYVNGVADPTAVVSLTTGIVTFLSPPANGAALTATYEFFVPVRFDSDYLEITLEWAEAGGIPPILLTEVLE